MDDHQTNATRRRRALFGSATLIFFTAGVATLRHAFPYDAPTVDSSDIIHDAKSMIPSSPQTDIGRRALSIALPDGGCEITEPKPTRGGHIIAPIWQASFPGSGSRMTWNFVQALTGVKTNSDRKSHGYPYTHVVASKTHWPALTDTDFEKLDRKYFSRAMVIIRNPVHAIPSYFNALFEQRNHLSTHTVRAPTEDWIKYRDEVYDGRLRLYEEMMIYWMEKYPDRQSLLLVPYEALTDTTIGPIVAGQIADFLRQGEGVPVIEPEGVACVWDTLINTKGNGSQRTGGPSQRPYTQQNLIDAVAMFHRLMGRYHYDQSLVSILQNYINAVSNIEPQAIYVVGHDQWGVGEFAEAVTAQELPALEFPAEELPAQEIQEVSAEEFPAEELLAQEIQEVPAEEFPAQEIPEVAAEEITA
mmetsp:Transcript_17691/g.36973  ORF Transcript_17691/g.36973 Transcript_17691/m.36973 type:complete len:416 (+) Transcript_17691:209-1456(+)